MTLDSNREEVASPMFSQGNGVAAFGTSAAASASASSATLSEAPFGRKEERDPSTAPGNQYVITDDAFNAP